MRVLSIQQPWAWCIVNGYKPIENRDWNTKVRGDVLIHAGKRYDLDGDDYIRRCHPAVPLPRRDQIECGGIVGRARLVRVVPAENSDALSEEERDWFVGHYGFVFADARPLPFVPLRGELGFFAVDDALVKR